MRRISPNYYTLDDIATLTAAHNDPTGFAASIGIGSIIDEVQRAPELLLAIKQIVDRDNTPGRFLLTGSADLLMLPRLSESLAGRMEILSLHPFGVSELTGSGRSFIARIFEDEVVQDAPPFPREELIHRIMWGGYPEVQRRVNDSDRSNWFANYIAAMLQRDIREIANIEDLPGMNLLLRLACLRSSTIYSPSELSRESQMPKTTLQRYMAVLEQAFLVFRLEPWRRDVGRRLLSTPKLFVNDTGLSVSQRGLDFHNLSTDSNTLGPLLETFVVNELRKQITWSNTAAKMYFYRDHNGLEVDVVLEDQSGRCVLIEVKHAASLGQRDITPITRLAEIFGKRYHRGVILYGGSSHVPFGKKLDALPFSAMWA